MLKCYFLHPSVCDVPTVMTRPPPKQVHVRHRLSTSCCLFVYYEFLQIHFGIRRPFCLPQTEWLDPPLS